MITEILNVIFRFVMLIGVQVLVLNNVQLSGFINPYLYILFILLLPVKFPKIPALVLGFIAGLVVDMFTNTIGMHAAACVAMTFARSSVLSIFAPRDGYEAEAIPNIKDFGFSWFLVYTSTLVFIYHLVLFYIEEFRFNEFFSTLLRVFLSSLVTLLLILITQFLFGKAKPDR